MAASSLQASCPQRLGKHVKDATTLSVAEVAAAWHAGRLQLRSLTGDNCTRHGLGTLVFEGDSVLLDGVALAPRSAPHYSAILNKPARVTCTTRAQLEAEHLGPWLAQMPPGTFPVGRLDRDTTGLLLFTTDGDLADAVLRPQHHTEKLYWLWLDEQLTPDDPRLAALLRDDDPRYDAATGVTLLHATEHTTELHLTLDRGKNRQIRRMCRALDLRLKHLHRKQVGSLTLGALPVGAFRQLDPAEVGALWRSTGHTEAAYERKLTALRQQAAQLREALEPHARLEAWLSSV